MSVLHQLSMIMEEAETEYRRLLKKAENEYIAASSVSEDKYPVDDMASNMAFNMASNMAAMGAGDKIDGEIHICDNAQFLSQLAVAKISKIDMIYVDPPFFSRTDQGARVEIYPTPSYMRAQIKNQEKFTKACETDGRVARIDSKARAGGNQPIVRSINAFGDIWGHDKPYYLKMLAVRLMLMKDVLSEEGTIFVHLDHHAVHEVKLLMDEIFGENHFINEIIWTYKSGGAAKRHFARKHDTILFYSKSNRYKFNLLKEKSYNRNLKPYRFKDVEEFEDDIGWYTMVNMKDVWQIDMVGRSSRERLNYATQKPEQLLERIINAVTDPGDTVADFFCGSGTLAAAAWKTGRHFICTDISSFAASKALKRTTKLGAAVRLHLSCPPTMSELTEKNEHEASAGSEAAVLADMKEKASAGSETSVLADVKDKASPGSEAAVLAGMNDGASIEFEIIETKKKLDKYVKITGYRNSLGSMNFEKKRSSKKSDEEIEELLKEDPVAFIDYWGTAVIFYARGNEEAFSDVSKDGDESFSGISKENGEEKSSRIIICPKHIAARDKYGVLPTMILLEDKPIAASKDIPADIRKEMAADTSGEMSGKTSDMASGKTFDMTSGKTFDVTSGKRVVFAFDVLGNIIIKDI